MGGNFKFQVQDSFLEYFFFEIWRSKTRIALSGKKPPLEVREPARDYNSNAEAARVEENLPEIWGTCQRYGDPVRQICLILRGTYQT